MFGIKRLKEVARQLEVRMDIMEGQARLIDQEVQRLRNVTGEPEQYCCIAERINPITSKHLLDRIKLIEDAIGKEYRVLPSREVLEDKKKEGPENDHT